MSFFDQLKHILKIDIDFSKLSSVKFFSDNKNDKVTYIDNRTMSVNVASIDSTTLPLLQQTLQNALSKDNYLIIDEKAQETLTDITIFEKQDENMQILDYFKGKISNNDLEILRASLYIKNVYQRGGQVSKLKEDIVFKYGNRGSNIANLCTAGYFTSVIKPLYQVMVESPQFTPSAFLDAFDAIVTNSPFAIFVNSQISLDDLIYEVETKITINKKYGIDYLYIHGIGEQNVQKIEDLLKAIKKYFTEKPDIEIGKKYIKVTIYF